MVSLDWIFFFVRLLVMECNINSTFTLTYLHILLRLLCSTFTQVYLMLIHRYATMLNKYFSPLSSQHWFLVCFHLTSGSTAGKNSSLLPRRLQYFMFPEFVHCFHFKLICRHFLSANCQFWQRLSSRSHKIQSGLKNLLKNTIDSNLTGSRSGNAPR